MDAWSDASTHMHSRLTGKLDAFHPTNFETLSCTSNQHPIAKACTNSHTLGESFREQKSTEEHGISKK
eukprot:1178226-Amphidinium_carterae.1